MRLRMECDIESTTELESPVDIVSEPYHYIFTPDMSGTLRKMAILAPVEHPDRFETRLDPSADLSLAGHVVFLMDEELVATVRDEFRAVESHLAFRYPVTRIRWDSPRYELLFDSNEERSRYGIHSFQITYETRTVPRKITPEGLAKVVVARHRNPDLVVPLSFHREGINEFNAFRFVPAFYNFYFVLEGLYADGNTKNRLVKRAFAKSRRFGEAFSEAIAMVKTQNPDKYQAIVGEFKSRNIDFTAIGAAELLVSTRGDLHHFTANDKRRQPTPFTYRAFETIAYFAKALAINAIIAETLTVNSSSISPDSLQKTTAS
jgi:hypothetical protein